LEKYNIVFNAFIDSVGGTKVSNQTEIEAAISTAKEKSDSVGATITIIIKNVPAGIGSDFFGGIEAKLSNLFFSIPACKGVEFGEGFELSKKNGSDTNDGIYIDENKKLYTKTNHMGGILGGISNGMDITARLAFKPTASIGLEQDSVDYKTFEQTKIIVGGRHDPCVALRAPVIVECYAALGILDLIMDFEKNK
jgi:chorismate synthase